MRLIFAKYIDCGLDLANRPVDWWDIGDSSDRAVYLEGWPHGRSVEFRSNHEVI